MKTKDENLDKIHKIREQMYEEMKLLSNNERVDKINAEAHFILSQIREQRKDKAA